MLKQIFKCQTFLIPHDTLSTHRNITRTIKTYYYDHWSAKTHIDD